MMRHSISRPLMSIVFAAALLACASLAGAQSPAASLDEALRRIEQLKAKLGGEAKPEPLAAAVPTTSSLAAPPQPTQAEDGGLVQVTEHYGEIMRRYQPVEQAALAATQQALEDLKSAVSQHAAPTAEPRSKADAPPPRAAPQAMPGITTGNPPGSTFTPEDSTAAMQETLRRCAERLAQVAGDLSRLADALAGRPAEEVHP